MGTFGCALLFISAFVPGAHGWPEMVIPAFGIFGFVGGLTVTWSFKLASEMSTDADVNCEASRVCVLYQNAGLSFGACFSGAFAAAYSIGSKDENDGSVVEIVILSLFTCGLLAGLGLLRYVSI